MEPDEKTYALAIRYLGIRPRSKWEMIQYLTRKGRTLAECEAAIERLGHAGLIDDQAFAESWVASRQALRPRSPNRLTQELLAKGVPKVIVEAVMAQIDESTELETLERVIAKKRRLAQYQDTQKLTSYLMRQGYSYDKIKEALSRLGD